MNDKPPTSILDRLLKRNPDATPAPTPTQENPPPPPEALARFERPTGSFLNRPAPGQINPPEAKDAPTPEQAHAANEAASKPEPAPTTSALPSARIRRTKDEIARGLTPEQAQAERTERANKAGMHEPAPGSELDLTPAQQVLTAAIQAGPDAPPPPTEAPKSPEVAAPTGTPAPVGVIRRVIPCLFVNCQPMGGAVALASVLAARANAKICSEQKVSDYRYLQYGAGPGALRAIVMNEIDTAQEGTVPAIMVDTATPEGAALANDLEARARQVVRGIR